jgi:hypothetical protein
MSQRIVLGSCWCWWPVTLLAAFAARQMLAPLNRIMLATRRSRGDLTPITHGGSSTRVRAAIAINYMLHELIGNISSTHKLKAVGTLTAGVAS